MTYHVGQEARTADDTAVLTAHGDDRPWLSCIAGQASHGRGAFGLYHFALLLPDRAALGRFAAHLAAQQIRVGMADHLVSEALYLSDPDGLGIEIYTDRDVARSTIARSGSTRRCGATRERCSVGGWLSPSPGHQRLGTWACSRR